MSVNLNETSVSLQKFVITVKIDFLPNTLMKYYSENAASDFMVLDVNKAKIFDTLDYAEGVVDLLPKSLYSHLEYVQLGIIEYKAV